MMTPGSRDDENGTPSLKQVEHKLRIKSGQSVAVVNAPPGSRLKLSTAGRCDPDHADVVIGFATQPVDLARLKSVYAAARTGRLAWLSYPKPGRPGTSLLRDWLLRALHQHGVDAVHEVSIDTCWTALRLRRSKTGGGSKKTPVLCADSSVAQPALPGGQ
jgi:hypothetical protein